MLDSDYPLDVSSNCSHVLAIDILVSLVSGYLVFNIQLTCIIMTVLGYQITYWIMWGIIWSNGCQSAAGEAISSTTDIHGIVRIEI